jgi:hypothetical protein
MYIYIYIYIANKTGLKKYIKNLRYHHNYHHLDNVCPVHHHYDRDQHIFRYINISVIMISKNCQHYGDPRHQYFHDHLELRQRDTELDAMSILLFRCLAIAGSSPGAQLQNSNSFL